MRFASYQALSAPRHADRHALVIAVSASGGTQRVLDGIAHAKTVDLPTIAVTGTADSPVTRKADRTLLVDLPGLEPSPGIRTYQASLLGLLLIANHAGQARNRSPDPLDADRRWFQQLIQVADVIEAATPTIRATCRDIADRIADAPIVMILGSGPSYGTAMYAAAKLIEGAGVFAAAQDLEEWLHVERYAHPVDMPLFVISPPGRSNPLATQLTKQASELGRRVTLVADEDTQTRLHPWAALPVPGTVDDVLSPLLYHLFAGYLASYLAQCLGRKPFQADLPRNRPW